MPYKRFVAAALVFSLLSGCYSMTLDVRDDAIRPASNASRVVRTVEHEERGWFIIGGLVPLNRPDFHGLKQQLRRDESLGGFKVTAEQSVLDGVIIVLGSFAASALGYAVGGTTAGATLGGLFTLLVPMSRTMTVRAEVVEAHSASSAVTH